MSETFDSQTDQINAALNWATARFEYESTTTITDHPWAHTLALHARTGDTYLKVLPAIGSAQQNRVLKSVADRFSNAVPQLLDSDAENGFFLYRDHQGETPASGWNADSW